MHDDERHSVQDFLAARPVMVLDGALATELEARGCDLNDPLWSARVLIEAPELIRQVHVDYFAAGADVATTASYQATFEGFARRGIAEAQAAALMRRSIELAREARDAFWAEPAHRAGRLRPLVAASVGPYGAMLADGSEYRGDYGLDETALMDFHRPRMAALLSAEPDLLACETVPCLAEARALARLLAEFPAARAWISFSCRDGAHNCQGEPLADCLAALAAFDQVVAVGLNCTAPVHVPALIAAAAQVTAKPILVYPNSGETYDPQHKCWHGPRDAAEFSAAARDWHRAGARLIGGCCRTGPAEIAAVSAWARGGAASPA
ncbi:MAG: homocysteine S-methyltransferase [Paludibacterium sp.]|uniref:homocysteine S-methyltransferase n=1 Tax=Paludibacterium sp. TaxID=1917523 RepID=UPI0025FB390A|nr:homocysteine S-methyltransferase [Paludibacterium sp.]MBV8046021.1 homocysteine S-methyltransferase [Paludibacterium sp.]MBV8648231.1 homocysteine S-methyltransferase [Paludibacterium sp.]